MNKSTASNTGKLATFAVYSNGKKIGDKYAYRSIEVYHEINRIGGATLKIVAGDMPDMNIPESASDDFKPGQNIKIELGYESDNTAVYEGIVVSQRIHIPNESGVDPLLIVECKDEAVKATVARKNKVFEKMKDSEVINKVLKDAGLSVTVDGTTPKHQQIVQYYCTDWDFALSRADASGLFITTDGAKVEVKKPKVSAGPVLKVTYGNDLFSFDGELYAEDQFGDVESIGWDPARQKTVVAKAATPSLNAQGNFSKSDISAVGADKVTLQTDALSDPDILREWASAALLKSGLSRFRGSFTFQGNAKAVPGCIIELAGLGARFNGKVFAGSVTHKMAEGAWITEVGMGLSPANITQQPDVVAPPASGLLPGIQGLHIGVVTKLADDPDSGYRIQVQIPLLSTSPDVLWVRLSQFSASNGAGSFFIPSVGDEVVLGFINDDPNLAVVLGCLYSGKHTPPYELDEKNYKRAVVTPEKLKLELDDEKKIITVTTPGGNTIVMDDDGKTIKLADTNKNEVVMSNSGIKLTSGKDIILSAKGKISLDSMQAMSLKSKQDLTLDGTNTTVNAQVSVKVKGSATAELSASGQTTVKGGMVMIN